MLYTSQYRLYIQNNTTQVYFVVQLIDDSLCLCSTVTKNYLHYVQQWY